MTADTLDQNKPPLLEPVQAAQLVSRQLDLPMQSEAVQKLAARLVTAANGNPTLRAAGPEGLKALIWAITPEDPARMDPMKQAEAMLARANITSGDAAVWGKVLESFRIVSAGNVSRKESESRRAEASLAVLDLGKINDGNFGLTEFRARGLSFGTFSELRAQGFNAHQIIAAAGLSTELKIDVNTNAVAIARLQRDVPGVATSLRESRDNWHAVGEAERKEAEAKQRGDNTAAAEWHKRGQEAKERAEQHDHEEHDHVQRVRPDRVPDLQSVQGHIKAAGLHLDAAMPEATLAEAREVRSAVDIAQRNPDNAEAQRRLEEIRAGYGGKLRSSRRFTEALAELKKVEVIKDANLHQRDEKAAATRVVRHSTQEKKEDTRATHVADRETSSRKENKKIQKAEEASGLNDGVSALFASDSDSALQKQADAVATPARPTQVATNAAPGKKLSPRQG
jgi:hypothetical protein